jgi:hypothetical protein
VIVRWRTDRPAKGNAFQVTGDTGAEPAVASLEDQPRRTRFVTNLRAARPIRSVTVTVAGELLSETRTTTVRVKG